MVSTIDKGGRFILTFHVRSDTIEDRLKHKVFAEIPLEDRLVLQSVNRGMPYMIMSNVDRRTPVIQRTGEFAQRIVQAFEETST
jgi:hypothetical protein